MTNTLKSTLLTVSLVVVAAVMAQAQKPHIPTLQEAVYGGLIRTEGGSNVNWIDGDR